MASRSRVFSRTMSIDNTYWSADDELDVFKSMDAKFERSMKHRRKRIKELEKKFKMCRFDIEKKHDIRYSKIEPFPKLHDIGLNLPSLRIKFAPENEEDELFEYEELTDEIIEKLKQTNNITCINTN